MQTILFLICAFFVCWLLFQQELSPCNLKEELKNDLILGSLAIYAIFFNLNQFYHFCKLPEFLMNIGMLLTVSMAPCLLIFIWEFWKFLTKPKTNHKENTVKKINKPQEKVQTTPLFEYTAKMEKLPVKKKKHKSRIDKLIEQMERNEYAGRIYEAKIGAIYEGKNYTVDYNGIEKGKEDGGIDLIATKGKEILLIQCKHWAAYKQIHKKYIGYLKVAVDLYAVPEGFNCRGVFFCSCPLSDEAKKAAKIYDFEVHENFLLNGKPA